MPLNLNPIKNKVSEFLFIISTTKEPTKKSLIIESKFSVYHALTILPCNILTGATGYYLPMVMAAIYA
jgi:hypothetical protein